MQPHCAGRITSNPAVRRPGTRHRRGRGTDRSDAQAAPQFHQPQDQAPFHQTIVIGAGGNITSDRICALTACGRSSFNAASEAAARFVAKEQYTKKQSGS
jgi:hypothetical protein